MPNLTSPLIKVVVTLLFIATLSSCLKPKNVDPEKQLGPATIDTISPISGVAGDTITITGTNFTTVSANDHVSINDVSAVVISASRTQLKVKAPAATTGRVKVTVNSKATVTGPEFTYLPAITITEISPATAGAGSEVAIRGTNFSQVHADNIVTFNGVPAKVQTYVTSENLLLVEVPQGATTGPVQVKIKTRTAVSNAFKVRADAPTLTWTELPAPPTMNERVEVAAIGSTFIILDRGAGGGYIYRMHNGQLSNVVLEAGVPNKVLNITSTGNTFYATVYSNGIIFRSDDLGLTWKKLTVKAGILTRIDAVLGDVIADGDRVFATYGGRSFVSNDKGETWEWVGDNVSPDFFYNDYGPRLQLGSDNEGKFYYCSAPLWFINKQPIYMSIDKGLTWGGFPGPFGYKYLGSAWGITDCVKVSDEGVFALWGTNNALPITDLRLFRVGHNRGADWHKVTDEPVNAIDCSGGYTMYGYGTFNVSSNGGISFKKYTIPTGYIISGIKEAEGYFYIFCISADGKQTKIFRAQHP